MGHILSVDQFTAADVDALCERAAFFADHFDGQPSSVLHGRTLINLFYEPSTRTSSSFHAAMLRLGGSVIAINQVNYSSVAKGESLEDTIRTMQCYGQCIVLRHPEVGAADRATAVSAVPIINAGDGDNEHPTQALLDYYTIKQHRERQGISGELWVIMMGDLARGRTVKSLSKLLRQDPGTKIIWVSPPDLRIQRHYVRHGEPEVTDISAVIQHAHVLYLTRVQHERGSSPSSVYGITPDILRRARSDMLVMHPLPRLNELPVSIDSDPRAGYFRQVQNGLFMRMAVLEHVMKR